MRYGPRPKWPRGGEGIVAEPQSGGGMRLPGGVQRQSPVRLIWNIQILNITIQEYYQVPGLRTVEGMAFIPEQYFIVIITTMMLWYGT